MKKFQNKTVVITGAGSGIGKALALAFADMGAQLALNDYDKDSLALTVQEAEKKGSKVYNAVFDVASKESMYDFAEQVISKFGAVDVVINNAGVALSKVSILDVNYEDLEWVMGINFWGMVYGSKAFLPHLVKQKEASLVNVSSLFGLVGIAHQSAYCTSKFAIRGFTETLRMELCLEHPHVVATSVHPGGIATNISKKSRTAKGMDKAAHEEEREKFEKTFLTISPGKAAAVIINGIKRKKGRVLIGNSAKIPSLLARIFPEKYINIIAREFKRKGFN